MQIFNNINNQLVRTCLSIDHLSACILQKKALDTEPKTVSRFLLFFIFSLLPFIQLPKLLYWNRKNKK